MQAAAGRAGESKGTMTDSGLHGVIAAIPTAVEANGEPDCARSTRLARYLLANGCNGLNVLGTTGEATSFSTTQRQRVMTAYRAAQLPMQQLMVGTGAAALADAVALTRHAAEVGFAGALVLPPFYYKAVADDGLFAYVEAIVRATADKPIPIYLYHFPAQSAVPWPLALIRRLLDAFGARIAGLKDSSGDLSYARTAAKLGADFKVFPSNEATLMEGRAGTFAGCISATANINADLCARAWEDGDLLALETAMRIRKLFDGRALVPGVKALLAHVHREPEWSRVQPPLVAMGEAERLAVIGGYEEARSTPAPVAEPAVRAAQAG
jgi:4-hydroxy-tetrahydrodipicolinate synthase